MLRIRSAKRAKTKHHDNPTKKRQNCFHVATYTRGAQAAPRANFPTEGIVEGCVPTLLISISERQLNLSTPQLSSSLLKTNLRRSRTATCRRRRAGTRPAAAQGPA